MVRQRIDDYLRCFAQRDMGRFDICHAQDSISANALATLAERGVIGGYVRTVHHLDQFDDARLHAWQERGYREADLVLCVSRTWQDILLREHGVRSALVSNGVDMLRYTPEPGPRDQALRHALGLTGAPLLLAVGGVEPRKNTLGILQAFAPAPRLSAGATGHCRWRQRARSRALPASLPGRA
jgi:glycosyltransferase involved in cell wall biosynthesis